MNRTLFAKELRANLFVSLIIAAVLAMYIGVIVSMYDPELGESLDAMMQSMPEMFAAFGMSVQATTLIDFMLNYLYGFLLTIFILVLILIVANKLMVRYLDRGAMAYLLATPNSRTRIALTMVTILVALMAVVTSLEAGFAEALFPGELDMQALMQVNAGLLALWLAMAGLCFLSACLFSNATAALWVGGGLNILFFLMQMVSQVGDKFEFLKNVNPLTLFDYYGLAAGDASAVGGAIALTVGAVALFAVAVAAFDRRDLSI